MRRTTSSPGRTGKKFHFVPAAATFTGPKRRRPKSSTISHDQGDVARSTLDEFVGTLPHLDRRQVGADSHDAAIVIADQLLYGGRHFGDRLEMVLVVAPVDALGRVPNEAVFVAAQPRVLLLERDTLFLSRTKIDGRFTIPGSKLAHIVVAALQLRNARLVCVEADKVVLLTSANVQGTSDIDNSDDADPAVLKYP